MKFGKIYTQSILGDRIPNGGIRISVMSRHTLNNGVTPDKRITSDCYDLWMKDLAPPAKLVGAYYRREIDWKKYELGYFLFLLENQTRDKVNNLADLAKLFNITLLCIENSAKFCHRRLLAKECQFYNSELEVIHLR